MESFESIVVGGGISGLAFAHALGEGADVCVLERSPRVGGLVHTVRVDEPVELRYEEGPEALTTSQEVIRLAEELELPLQEAPVSKRYLVHRGVVTAVPTAPHQLLGTRLLSTRGKLRLLSEPWRRSGVGLDGSIADFVRHRLGDEALEALVDPLVSGIHAGDPGKLSARACFPRLVRMVEEHGSLFAGLRAARKTASPRPVLAKPRGGMQGLAGALEGRLGARVRPGVAVTGVRPGRRGWSVDTSEGRLQAAQVVLALPLGAAKRLLRAAAPEAALALDGMESESLVSVIGVYPREGVEHDLDGFGYLVPRCESLQHLGTLFSSSIDPTCCTRGFVLLRVLLGGARRPHLLGDPDDVLRGIVEDEVHSLLGIEGEPVWSVVERYREVLPRFGLDHGDRLRRLESALPPGLTVLGNYTHGIGLASLVEEARRAALRVQGEMGSAREVPRRTEHAGA